MASSVTPELPWPVGVVCHDAGGANQIFAMLREFELGDVTAYMEGPARMLWRDSFPGAGLARDMSSFLAKLETLITGTGWASDLEHEARLQARNRGIYSVAVLDHWTNYPARFERAGVTVLPDELWVVDECALDLALASLPAMKITLLPDFFAAQQLRAITPVASLRSNEMLYLLEPMRSNWQRCEPGEFQALRYFLEHLGQLGLPEDVVIRLRPHPSEAPGKYDSFLSESKPFRIVFDDTELSQSLSRARWVAGCQTYAMTLALKAGRTVYSPARTGLRSKFPDIRRQ